MDRDAITVIVCDDLHGNLLRDAAHKDRRKPAIEVFVVQTGAELVESLDHDFDVAVIDNHVPHTALDGPNPPRAHRLVAEMTRARGRDYPYRILWANDPDPLTIYTFRAFGGHNYANKNQKSNFRVMLDTIRATVAGATWEPPMKPLESEEDERRVRRELRLIALLANGERTESIATQLGTTAATVTTTIGKLADAFGLGRNNGRYDVHIPRSAQMAGYYFVPKEHWPYAPPDFDEVLWPGELPRRVRA